MKLLRVTCYLFMPLLSLVALAFVFVPTAAAKEPTHQRFEVTRHIDPFVTCSGFNVIGDFLVERDDVTFFDSSGTPIKMVIHAHFLGTLTNSVTGISPSTCRTTRPPLRA